MGLSPEWAVDLYNGRLYVDYQEAWEMADFVYALTNLYELSF